MLQKQQKPKSICGHTPDRLYRSRHTPIARMCGPQYTPKTVALLAFNLYGLELSHEQALALMYCPATAHLPIPEVIYKLVCALWKVAMHQSSAKYQNKYAHIS